jgi:transposase-like protein
MAKGKYEEWLTEDGLILIEGWARDGLTDEQIAHNMGINRDTLYTWKKKYPDISEALKKTKDVVDREVENALYKKALEGDTTAMIFWLKNRRPNDWRDKRENLQTFKGDVPTVQVYLPDNGRDKNGD